LIGFSLQLGVILTLHSQEPLSRRERTPPTCVIIQVVNYGFTLSLLYSDTHSLTCREHNPC